MIRKTLRILVVIVACSFAFSCHGQITAPVADQAPPVFNADHNFLQTHSLNETINPATGAVSLKITIDVPGGRGMTADFSVQYDSNSAHHGHNWMGNAGYLSAGGWSYVFPSVSVSQGLGGDQNPTTCSIAVTPDCSGGEGPACPYYGDYMMTDVNGATHGLPLMSLTSGNCHYPYGVYQNLSGGDSSVTGVTQQFNTPGAPTPLLTASDNDGTVYTFNSASHQYPGDNIYPTSDWMSVSSTYTAVANSIEDRNGNIVNVTDQNNGKISIKDTLGRTSVSTDGFGMGTTHITVPGLNPYTVIWQQQPFAASWNTRVIVDPGTNGLGPPEPTCTVGTTPNGVILANYSNTNTTVTSSVTASENADQPVISELDLPNGQKYLFLYDWNGTTGTGLLKQVTYPDGAVVNYYWTINPRSVQETSGTTNPQYACEMESDTPALQMKTVKFDGTNVALEQDYNYAPTTWVAGGGTTSGFEHWTAKKTTVTTKLYAIVNGSQQLTSQYETVYNYVPMAVPAAYDPYGAQTGAYVVNPVESSIVYYADMGQTPLKQVNKTYWDYWQRPTDVKETVDNGQTKETQTCYLGVTPPAGSLCPTSTISTSIGSLISDVFSLDYGTATGSAATVGTPGALLQHKHADYNSFTTPLYPSTPTILDRASDIKTYDGSGTEVAEADYCYDNATASFPECQPSTSVAPASATQHDETNYAATSNNPRGNVTTAISRCFVGGTGTPCTQGDTVAQYAWYETGQMASKTDALGNTTSFSYVDNFANDDANEGGPSSPTNAYLTSLTDALGHKSTFQYAFNDGALRSITDPNGAVTHYYYYAKSGGGVEDPLRRFMESDVYDSNGNLFGQTQVSYNDTPYAPNITTQKKLDSRNVTTVATSDGMGHVYKTQLTTDPSGTDETDTTFDGLARAYSITNPFRSTSDPTYGVTTTQYDALGRATKVTRQDGSVVTTDYSGGSCTTVTDEINNQRKSCSDGLGRLVEVDEPGDWQSAIPATATLAINGNSLKSYTYPATYSSGSIVISENNPCRSFPVGAQGYQTVCDWGTIWVTINNGHQITASYIANNGTYNLATIASNLAAAINSDSVASTIVTASAGNGTVTLTAKAAGAITYAVSAGATTSAPCPGPVVCFNPPGFTASWSNVTGGVNARTTYDYGTLKVTIGSWTSSAASYGNNGANSGNNTNALALSALNSVLNASGSPVTSQVTSSGLLLTEKTPGAAADGTQVSVNSTSGNSSLFGSGSFSGNTTMLGGGYNAGSTLRVPYVTLYYYDGLGNLKCVEQHGDSTSGAGCKNWPNPPSSANPDPWRPRMFTYNSLSQLLTAYNPETGTIAYAYDKDGNVSTKTDARGVAITYGYDALNRVTGKTFSSGDPAVTFTYDQGTNGIGRRTGMTDASGSTSWTYDGAGEVLSEQRQTDGVTQTIGYKYLMGNLTQITYPNGTQINYAYDNAGRVQSVSDGTHSLNYVASATYAPNGSLAGFNEQVGGTITNSYLYNPRLQICREMASTTGVVPQSCTDGTHTGNVMDFQYDFHSGLDNGNLYTATNNKDTTRTQTYTYDTLNRLLSATTSGTDCSVTVPGGQTKYWGEKFTYDPWANLTGKATSQCTAENAALTGDAGNLNRLLTASYDAAGNMVNNGVGTTFTYDGESQMVSAAGYTYLYDGDGNRVGKTNGSTGTLYWYGSPGIVLETDLLGNPQSEYVFFGGQRVARRDVGGVQNLEYYYFSNQIHSAALMTDVNGNVLDDDDYYPWGGRVPIVDNLANHYWFTGKERDAESGLDYFGARYYGNTFGRFTTPDWSAKVQGVPYADFGDPQSLNLYGYVRNSPMVIVDPDGHCWSGFGWACNIGQRLSNLAAYGYFKTDAQVENIAQKGADRLRQHGYSAEGLKTRDLLKVANLGVGAKTFQSYIKRHPNLEPYSGRTSGTGTPEENVQLRDRTHHMNEKGYGEAELDKSSSNPDAIRGREQQLIESNGGAQSTGGTSGNAINGISEKNPNKARYMDAAKNEFGTANEAAGAAEAAESAETTETVVEGLEILNDIP